MKSKAERILDMNDYLLEMEKDSIRWHKEKKCDCMKNFKEEITRMNYNPCEHLRDFLWWKNRKRVRTMQVKYSEIMAKELKDTLSSKQRTK